MSDLFELVKQDESDRDGEVGKDKDNLDPTIEETMPFDGLSGPFVLVRWGSLGLSSSHGLDRAEILKLGNLDEVWQLEELFNALLQVPLIIVNIDDLHNLSSSLTVKLIVIIKVKDIGKEGLHLHLP